MNHPDKSHLRLLPAVERVLRLPDVVRLCARHGRAAVTDWVRDVLAELRCGNGQGLPTDDLAMEARVFEEVEAIARRHAARRLQRVINATGIVIHTNLGRAPLAARAVEAVGQTAGGTNLELDLASGQRGRRGDAVESLWRDLTGAEDALVVNNCAAATLLTLQTLAAGRSVVISRGQLIEIGGSFRLPEVFQQAGVQLIEVGTTNRTRLADYASAIGPQTAALLRVHPSNYRVTGFCESVGIAELARLGKSHELPVIDDIGSGCLLDLSRYGLPDEPVVRDSLDAGADLVIFSGDKLLGGPQCGIILGRAEFVGKLRANPLFRALRVDKLILSALQGTLEIHRAGRAFQEIPVLRQLSLSANEIRPRAERLCIQLQERSPTPNAFSVQAVASAPGGGSLPEQTLASWAIAVASLHAEHCARALRLGVPAVVPRVQDDQVLLDLRTVDPEDDDVLLERILACAAAKGE